jgi:hypothetical protein
VGVPPPHASAVSCCPLQSFLPLRSIKGFSLPSLTRALKFDSRFQYFGGFEIKIKNYSKKIWFKPSILYIFAILFSNKKWE